MRAVEFGCSELQPEPKSGSQNRAAGAVCATRALNRRKGEPGIVFGARKEAAAMPLPTKVPRNDGGPEALRPCSIEGVKINGHYFSCHGSVDWHSHIKRSCSTRPT